MRTRPRIGIDARLFSQTGVGVYIRNLLAQLEPYADQYDFVCFVRSEDRYEMQDRYSYLTTRVANERWHSLNEQVGLLLQVLRERVDLMHFTYFSYPILYRRPFICTIHDLTPLLHKTGRATSLPKPLYELKHKALRLVLQSALTNARAIITPSKAVKSTILDTFSVPKERIHPIYEGVNERLLNAEPQELPDTIHTPFLLYVGNYYPHKNVRRLVEAMEQVDDSCMLVLVGPEDIFAKRLKVELAVAHPSLEKRVLFLHDVPDGQLAQLYRKASALVHPAIDEGFGLTLAEAQAFGTPILASDIRVFHELFKDAFVPFDPMQSASIAQVINDHLKKPHRPHKTTSAYSFKTMAKETVELYRSCLR